VVRGDAGAPPEAPKLRFDTLEQRNAYADSIVSAAELDLPRSGRFVHHIVATHPIAQKTEDGYGPWDMKPMLLSGPKARTTQGGDRFNIIPFRHATSGDDQSTHFSGVMPPDIYEQARNLRASTSRTGGGVNYAERLTGTEETYPPITKRFRKPSGEQASYTHKRGIYEGMVRMEAGYAKTRQSAYLTFRVVSDNSDPNAWWHPGRPPQPVVAFVVSYCQPRIEALLREAAVADLVSADAPGLGMTITRRG
jgi:hypothetical protein